MERSWLSVVQCLWRFYEVRLKTLLRTAALLALLSSAFVLGCATRTIYVKDGVPVRLRQTLHDVKVWVADSNGVWHSSTMTIPEGWYCLSDPE